jgi:hypothetical protein
MNLKKYTFTIFLIFISFLLLVLTFNRLIDPYGLYENPRVNNLNMDKPIFEKHIRMAKAFAVKDKKPNAVILGSSKAEFGFDPDSELFENYSTYNLGLPGPNLYELYRYFQHANYIKNQKKILLFLDFYMFNASLENKVDFDERILSVSYDGKPQYTSGNKLALLTSLDALIGSINTIKLQNTIHYKYLQNGMRERHHMQERVDKEGGHRKLFSKKENTFINKLYKNYQFSNEKIKTWDIYKKILTRSYEKNTELHIAIPPMHLVQMKAISKTDNWPNFEIWKTKLVNENERIAKLYNQTPFPIWDFSVVNQITLEKLPPINKPNNKMKWWWDTHFKSEIGDLILDVMLSNHDNKEIGAMINSKNIDEHLYNIKNDFVIFISKNH